MSAISQSKEVSFLQYKTKLPFTVVRLQAYNSFKNILEDFMKNIGLSIVLFLFLATASFAGEVFNACGNEWRVGKNNLSWIETQSWINGLGGGWRAPTIVKLQELYNQVGQKSPIRDDKVWAEPRNSSSSNVFAFYDGTKGWFFNIIRGKYLRGVAVRPHRTNTSSRKMNSFTPVNKTTSSGYSKRKSERVELAVKITAPSSGPSQWIPINANDARLRDLFFRIRKCRKIENSRKPTVYWYDIEVRNNQETRIDISVKAGPNGVGGMHVVKPGGTYNFSDMIPRPSVFPGDILEIGFKIIFNVTYN